MKKRKVEIAVVSDVHLGTYGCRAKELLRYLKSIQPKTLILNGDIIDIWQFSKKYFPKSHLKIVKYLTHLLTKNVKIYYITGNHDEMLRKFKGLKLGSFEIQNKLVLDLDGEKAWFFHGDVFDITMKHSKWLAKLGGKGYDLLILLNTMVNWVSEKLGRGRLSFSKKVKNGVKGAVKHISEFEETAIEIGAMSGYNYVVCGHIHQPEIRDIVTEEGVHLKYLNSGDWVENLTALEFNKGEWSLYEFDKDPLMADDENAENKDVDLSLAEYKSKELYMDLMAEFENLISIRTT